MKIQDINLDPIRINPDAKYGNHDGLEDEEDEMKVEREGDRIRIYSDVDRMLPLVSMELEVARKLYFDLGEALAAPIQCCDNPKLSYGLTRDQWICTNCKTDWRTYDVIQGLEDAFEGGI